MLNNRISDLTLLGDSGVPFPAPIEAIATLEQYGYDCGLIGFVDFESGEEITARDDWYDFTTRFMEYAFICGRSGSYCRLAVAMAKADGMDNSWDYYIELARLLALHYEELSDLRLTTPKAKLEAQGWTFTYFPDEFRWQAEIPGIEIRGRTLKETLANINTYALPTLAMWSEHAAARLQEGSQPKAEATV